MIMVAQHARQTRHAVIRIPAPGVQVGACVSARSNQNTATSLEMNTASGRGLSIAAVIVAGVSVFLLPFVLARVFRPTLLDVFGLTNLELGTAYSVYGTVAMAAYFFGGPLADKFRARTMLAVALTATAAGGLVMMPVPRLSTLVISS